MNFKKFKTKIVNTIDITLLVVIVSIILAAIFMMNNKQIYMLFDRANSSTLSISIADETITADNFSVGDKIYLSNSSKSVGTIQSVKNIKEKKYSAINNSLMYDFSDNNIGILIEIETKIKVDNDMKYLLSSVFVAPGSKFTMKTDNVPEFDCVVEEIIVH